MKEGKVKKWFEQNKIGKIGLRLPNTNRARIAEWFSVKLTSRIRSFRQKQKI